MTEAARGRVRVEPSPKRVRTYVDGEVVADSRRPLLVWEGPHYPIYYFPLADVRATLTATGDSERSPSRGTGDVYDVVTSHRTVPAAAKRYADSPFEELREAVRLDWAAMDEWLEEDEPVYTHPRDPYHRVDIVNSRRHVRIELDGVTLAESRSSMALFETGLPTRWYLPLSDLRLDLMSRSDKVTHCPYKGAATYLSVDVEGKAYPDLVWMYRSPLAESQKIAGLACFYNERVDVYLDGELQDRPVSPFS
jgi:uncharacterized protein (DUF427 family)